MPIWNPEEECLHVEERGQQQLERLQSTLNRAFKNVPFYRNRFEKQGIGPADVEDLRDLCRIPFIQREHFSDNYPYGLFAVPLRDVVRIHTARGTGLKPTVSGYTRQDLLVWREILARALTAAGVTSSDILQIDLDSGLANWGRDYKDGAEAIGASVIPLTILPPEKQLMVMRDYRTSVLLTSASGATQWIHHLFKANLNPNALALKTLLLVGDAPDSDLQVRLEEQLHVKTWVHYGLSEVPGPALAFECEERQGLHVNEDHFLAEVIDPGTGNVLPDGEVGELVLTTLTTRAFPLIRFRTGDMVRLTPGACPCGRTLKKMEWFAPQSEEVILVRGVKIYRQQILRLLERALGFIPGAYRFIRSHQDRRDSLEVWLMVDERVFSDEIKEMEKLAFHLGMELAQELGVPVRIRFKERETFGKHEQVDGS
ncbi:phenylacetate--CoA ligase family protein [Desulforhabdus amnigena]|uniref:Phenylacetate-coenzyme A ligase n=1 Tax=Desulforhabdus amnigena TaxID=40218 RepID=A0A9W6D330_9BACT|nr:phenylacetate--CoA ligase family protein [Desulforhabdus amnigena]NLJ29549.1 phenylacetate--CoA ligase [Deltaproteobacteria bacterium]GLI34014.1 phenylacetate-coenzyme A ligase [Desulforhabdus amnigena]